MPEQTIDNTGSRALPGLDPEATPLLGVGLGLTGIVLGVKPRFAPVPLALTALTALMYRNPTRNTPDEQSILFAPADGLVLNVDEYYEHRFLHTDAVRVATVVSPVDVPIARSPVSGVVRYVERVNGSYRSVQTTDAPERNTRTYIGIEAAWGLVLVLQIAGPLARRMVTHVEPGDQVQAGERIGTARFGSRTDLLVQRDSIKPLIAAGQRLAAGSSRVAQVVPL